MRTVTTSKNDQILLDDADYQYLIIDCKYTYYALRKNGKIENARRRASRSLHPEGKQQIHFIHHDIIGKPLTGKVTDHRDGNPLNNQRDNLWHCTSRQNSQNFRHENNTRNYSSNYPGVHWDKSRNKWRATARINGKKKHLGYYDNEFDAAIAYINFIKQSKGR